MFETIGKITVGAVVMGAIGGALIYFGVIPLNRAVEPTVQIATQVPAVKVDNATPTNMAEPDLTVEPPPTAVPPAETPSPTVQNAPNPTPTCDANALTIDDYGCVESDRDTVEITQNDVLEPLARAQPRYLNANDKVNINEGKAIFSFFGGKLHVENGSEIQIADTAGIPGTILFLFNRGSLVGEFEGDGNTVLKFRLVNGSEIEITGTQFFIDLNTDTDFSGNEDGDSNGRTEPKAIVGNISGSVRVNGQRLPGGNMFLLDDNGEIVETQTSLDPLDWTKKLDSDFEELDELNRTSYLVAFGNMNIRTGSSPGYDPIGILKEGQFVEVLGLYDVVPTNPWWLVDCSGLDLEVAETPEECWVWGGDENLTYPVNTDVGVPKATPVLPEPTKVPTATPTETATPTLTPTNTPTVTPTETEVALPPPLLLKPAANAQIDTEDCEPTDVVLSWLDVSGADRYEVNVYEYLDGFLSAPIFSEITALTNSVVMHDRCSFYCWEVRTVSEQYGDSDFTPLRGYQVNVAPNEYTAFCTSS